MTFIYSYLGRNLEIFSSMLTSQDPWSRVRRVLDLLIQYYDPLLYRFLKSTQRDIARRAVNWIKSLFRDELPSDDVTSALWDIIFQSVDPLLPLWIRYN